jgi:hypothetical protein
MSPKTDDVNLQGTLDMLKNSRRVGKLAKSDRAIISDGKITLAKSDRAIISDGRITR